MACVETAELWLWQTVTEANYTDRETNIQVAKEVNKERGLIIVIRKRMIKFFGHLVSHSTLIGNILEGKLLVKENYQERDT